MIKMGIQGEKGSFLKIQPKQPEDYQKENFRPQPVSLPIKRAWNYTIWRFFRKAFMA